MDCRFFKAPLFGLLKPHQLLEVAQEVMVIYKQKGVLYFQQDEPGHPQFYIVHKDAVAIPNKENNPATLDKRDEGDVFSLRPLFAKENYLIECPY